VLTLQRNWRSFKARKAKNKNEVFANSAVLNPFEMYASHAKSRKGKTKAIGNFNYHDD